MKCFNWFGLVEFLGLTTLEKQIGKLAGLLIFFKSTSTSLYTCGTFY
jgi:hypothetical protein